MATLFAANGGAIVALLGLPAIELDKVALGWFAAGLLLSILMGIGSTMSGHRMAARVTAIKVKVDQALLERVLDHEILSDLAAAAPNWKTFVPSYLGIAAFVSLIVGIMMVGIRL